MKLAFHEVQKVVIAVAGAASLLLIWTAAKSRSDPLPPRTASPILSVSQPINHPATTPSASSDKLDFTHKIAPLLKEYCINCHSGEKPKGDLSLEFKDEQTIQKSVMKDRAAWALLAGKLRKNEMPPPKKKQPTAPEKDVLLTWVEHDLLAIDCGGQADPGHVTLRRLNKAEYNNTIRDLFGIDDFKPAEDFPADDAGYGFDNNGDTLTLSPLLLEQYLKAAEQVMALVAKNKSAKAKLFASVVDLKETFYNRQDRAKVVLQAVLPRVYRQPVTDDQIERLMKFVRLSLSQDGESGDRAVMLALRAALVSPRFIFHLEMDPGSGSGNDIIPVSEYELANRLSYFLWSSLPDEELFKLAAENKLRANLPAQVSRMLNDPRGHALTENFAGQWLELRGMKDHAVDTKLYPAFNEGLRRDMVTETQLFFSAIVKEDRSILDFLDSDFTFLNGRLAALYQIDGISGDQFQRVQLTGGRRGGILTQASILTLTSTPTRTSPVKRGKWILDNILNAPPPPPPPDVPALEGDGKPLTGTLRQVMEKHRADPGCMVCHVSIDPLGLAFENFDAIGAWRERDGNTPIDAAGELKDGTEYQNVQELRAILRSKDADFRRCLTEKMMLYALGRGLDPTDQCAIDSISDSVAKSGNKMSSLFLALVKSDPFNYRKGAASVAAVGAPAP